MAARGSGDSGKGPPRDGEDLLVRLSRLHPTWVVVVTVGLFLGALLLPDPLAAAVFLMLAAGLGWLLARTWPVLPAPQRVIRLVIVALLVVLALTRVTL